jgi:hypothetical protein
MDERKDPSEHYLNLPLLHKEAKDDKIINKDIIFLECGKLLFKKYLPLNLRDTLEVGKDYRLFYVQTVERKTQQLLAGIGNEIVTYLGTEDTNSGKMVRLRLSKAIEREGIHYNHYKHLSISDYAASWFLIPKDTKIGISY